MRSPIRQVSCRNGITASVLALTLSLAGCAIIARDIATDLAKDQVTRLSKDFHIRGSAAAYLACLKSHGGACGNDVTNALPDSREALAGQSSTSTTQFAAMMADVERADFARAKRTDFPAGAFEVQKRISLLYDKLTGVVQSDQSLIKTETSPGGTEVWEVEFGADDLEAYYTYLDEKTFGDGWRADAETAARSLADTPQTLAPEGKLRRRQFACLTKFEEEYFRAYFRDGQFIQINVNAKNLTNELKKQFPLLAGVKDNDLEDILTNLGVRLNGALFGNVGTLGFVTRGGLTFQFPVLAVGLDPTAKQAVTLPKVEAVGTGSDMIRVFLEAFFDSLNGLPGVNNATGCFKDEAQGGCSLPVFDPTRKGRVTAEQFGDVNTISNQAEAAASSAFGRLVRGAGPIALNNEALARLLETLVGVTVRKAVEKGAWCWFACKMGLPEFKSASAPEEMVIRVTVRTSTPRVAATGH